MFKHRLCSHFLPIQGFWSCFTPQSCGCCVEDIISSTPFAVSLLSCVHVTWLFHAFVYSGYPQQRQTYGSLLQSCFLKKSFVRRESLESFQLRSKKKYISCIQDIRPEGNESFKVFDSCVLWFCRLGSAPPKSRNVQNQSQCSLHFCQSIIVSLQNWRKADGKKIVGLCFPGGVTVDPAC